MKRKHDLLRLSALGVGAVFLFNPTVNIVDLLPDFIGFWLFAYGLTAIASLSELLWNARKNFIYLAFLEAAKALISLALPGASGTFVVLMTFCFSVAEAVLFLPAASQLFEGLSSLGMRYGSDSTFYVPLSAGRIKKLSAIEKKLSLESDVKKIVDLRKKQDALKRPVTVGALKILTVAAFLVRAAGALIPTLPSLMLYGDTLFVTEGQINWSNYVGIFYILAWTAGFCVGIPWLLRFRRYIKGVVNETSFTGAVYEKYEKEILSDTGRLTANRMKKVMVLTVIAVLFTFQFPIDFINATPNLIAAGFLIAALVYLTQENRKGSVAGIVSCGIWAVLSGIGVWLQRDFAYENYTPPAAVAFGGEGRGMADELYFRMEIFSYAEALLFLVSALIFAKVFAGALSKHIGMMPPRRDGLARDEKALKKCLIPVVISGGVVILFNFALTFVTKYFTGAWIINGLAVIVFVVFSLLAYYKLEEKVYLPLKRKF